MTETRIVEIFSSIQGEGLLVGARQIFIRFFPCNLSCRYCDTPTEESEISYCMVEKTPGARDFHRISNPVDTSVLNEAIAGLQGFKGLHHSISLTGGEPLLQVGFLKAWLPDIGQRFRLYLETNGTLYEALKEVIDHIDIIAMDIKLPETAGIEPRWEDHYWFLKTAMKKRVFVKVVVSAVTKTAEFLKAAEMVGKLDRDIPFIIQPVTPTGKAGEAADQKLLIEFHRMAAGFVNQARIIPQTHKMMGML